MYGRIRIQNAVHHVSECKKIVTLQKQSLLEYTSNECFWPYAQCVCLLCVSCMLKCFLPHGITGLCKNIVLKR